MSKVAPKPATRADSTEKAPSSPQVASGGVPPTAGASEAKAAMVRRIGVVVAALRKAEGLSGADVMDAMQALGEVQMFIEGLSLVAPPEGTASGDAG